ncbi:response regulator transcription factor [Fodinisporobacter ferrooxydans]|uniref:Response regulator transcription factor n=1 Tax=Fodinisporobacter ferrooxydans TaxID=2901836 RepID=A0ABY4CSW1_9BACL|nr:response regulator transcription factor [Alicyclobacillaceae bacterium MYW30-H2]
MNTNRILAVDDEWNMRNLIRIYLTKNGFHITEAKNGHEAIDLLETHSFDLMILDVMMPDMNGWEICAKVRETSQIPILMVTARTETKDKVYGLMTGADDYVVKPFDAEELMARVFALLRRSNALEIANLQQIPQMIAHQELVMDPERRQVTVNDHPIELTIKEFDVLVLLAEHPQRVFSREAILERIWGADYSGGERTVDTHVKNVRLKLRDGGLSYSPIQTVWGIGYKFQKPADAK